MVFLQGSSVERSGAAQGLAEVLSVLGPDYLDALLPDILAACSARAAFTREGNLTLFKFLPLTIPDEFRVRSPCLQPQFTFVSHLVAEYHRVSRQALQQYGYLEICSSQLKPMRRNQTFVEHVSTQPSIRYSMHVPLVAIGIVDPIRDILK